VRLPFQYGPDADEFTAEITIEAGAAWRGRALAAGQGVLAEKDDGSIAWRVPARSRSRLLRFVVEHGPGVRIAGPPDLIGELEAGLREVEAAHG
ncbi:MAG: WYL domain-containing protein, partial [Actinobacteria bacterium]